MNITECASFYSDVTKNVPDQNNFENWDQLFDES